MENEETTVTTSKRYHLKPLGNNVALKLEEPEAITKGGIILPDQAQDRSQLALVIETGPGLLNLNGSPIPMIVKCGDLVIINKHAPVELKLPDGTTIHMLPEGDIISILEEVEEESNDSTA